MEKKEYLFFGGTFNPIHIGHLIIAQTAFHDLDIFNKVVFIPNGNPPHKDGFVSAYHRSQMCKIAIQENPNFEVEDYEYSKEGHSYTIETIDFLRKKYKIEKPYWLIGFDNLKELPTWYKINELVEKCIFVVGLYPVSSSECLNSIPTNLKMNLLFFNMPRADVRSTIIRKKILEKESVIDMVPYKVNEYIKNNKLYIKI